MVPPQLPKNDKVSHLLCMWSWREVTWNWRGHEVLCLCWGQFPRQQESEEAQSASRWAAHKDLNAKQGARSYQAFQTLGQPKSGQTDASSWDRREWLTIEATTAERAILPLPEVGHISKLAMAIQGDARNPWHVDCPSRVRETQALNNMSSDKWRGEGIVWASMSHWVRICNKSWVENWTSTWQQHLRQLVCWNPLDPPGQEGVIGPSALLTPVQWFALLDKMATTKTIHAEVLVLHKLTAFQHVWWTWGFSGLHRSLESVCVVNENILTIVVWFVATNLGALHAEEAAVSKAWVCRSMKLRRSSYCGVAFLSWVYFCHSNMVSESSFSSIIEVRNVPVKSSSMDFRAWMNPFSLLVV